MVFYLLQSHFNYPTLRLAPVLYHDLSYLPHPFLARHILLAAKTEPQLARQVINACAIAPGQRRAGETALAHLQAQELAQQAQQHQFLPITELQGEWLPGVEGAAAPLLSIREVAFYLNAAITTSLAYPRLQHLERATEQFEALGNQLLTDSSLLGSALKTTLPIWQQVINDLRQQAEQLARQTLPNPFRAGDPLSPKFGPEVFRGRTPLAKRIEALLVEPQQSISIALLGPRRIGKTSLLQMLPKLLPDAICVFFDLQANPIDSPAGFFKALAKRAQEQARHRLSLPPLPEGTPFEAGSQWLQQLETVAGERRILICIDEFERLEEVFPGTRRELLQLMGLFRATIQHQRRVRLLVSGVAPFEELDVLWSDHFINLREIRIGHLDKDTAIELLTCPFPEFPRQAIPTALAAAIFERTGGQPYLLQLYGSLLVQHLNDHERKQADMADLPSVEEQVLEQAYSYFNYIVKAAPEPAQAALIALAEQHSVSLEQRTRRWLNRRCLLNAEGQLMIPVLGEWIREYW